jgi:hypothetical protein
MPDVVWHGVGPSQLTDMVRKGLSNRPHFEPQNGILGVEKSGLSETGKREEASLVKPRRTGREQPAAGSSEFVREDPNGKVGSPVFHSCWIEAAPLLERKERSGGAGFLVLLR